MEEAERERERERVRERDGGGFSAPGGLVFAFGRGGGAEGNRVNVEKAKNAEAVARRVYEELVEGEKHISVAKVAQSTLTALGVSSFELLGFRMQDVTCLRNLALVEGKVCPHLISIFRGFGFSSNFLVILISRKKILVATQFRLNIVNCKFVSLKSTAQP